MLPLLIQGCPCGENIYIERMLVGVPEKIGDYFFSVVYIPADDFYRF